MTTAEGTSAAPQTPAKGQTSAPKTTTTEKKTITLTFEGADVALHAQITKDADDDERTPSLNLLRFVRKFYGKVPAATGSSAS